MNLPLSVWIRTHTQRLYLAEQLETMCKQKFGERVELLDTGEASPHFSLKFAICLANRLDRPVSEYILILEDDIALTGSSFEAVAGAIHRGDNCNWYTVVTTTDILKHAIYAQGYGYILTAAKHINYSGAVLIRSEVLRGYIAQYFEEAIGLEYKNFDVNVSAYLLRNQGSILLRPGHFRQRSVPSSVNYYSHGRATRSQCETYRYRGPAT